MHLGLDFVRQGPSIRHIGISMLQCYVLLLSFFGEKKKMVVLCGGDCLISISTYYDSKYRCCIGFNGPFFGSVSVISNFDVSVESALCLLFLIVSY